MTAAVIVGAKRLDQLTDNLAAVSELPPEYPGWTVAVQGADRLGPVDLWKETTNASSVN